MFKMFKRSSTINKWHIVGVFWIIIVGSLLHYTYEWSGRSPIVGAFSAINESVWEHLKLGYFPVTFFMLIEYWFLKKKTNSYFTSKLIGILCMLSFILIVHYSYELILKKESMIVDIGGFIIGAIICQLISSKIMKMRFSKKTESIALGLYIILGILFVVFTFYPPDLPIFKAVVGNHYFFVFNFRTITMVIV